MEAAINRVVKIASSSVVALVQNDPYFDANFVSLSAQMSQEDGGQPNVMGWDATMSSCSLSNAPA